MTTQILGLPAPAKLNLFLHVTGRRPDGYHTLESVFFLISLADSVSLTDCPEGRIERTGDVTGPHEQDLCVRAARCLQKNYAPDRGVRIHVKKRIPVGAGLGGGSSDAATTLIGLNRLWNLRLSRQQLLQIGVGLGADVPFFLYGRTAFARGIGDELTPFDLPAARWLIAMPETATSTAGIFSDPVLTRATKSLKIALFSEQVHSAWPMLPGQNDLQPIVVKRNAAVAQALACLGPQARMTGSGSAVFCYIDSADQVQKKLLCLPQSCSAYVVDTKSRHPLASWLQDQLEYEAVS